MMPDKGYTGTVETPASDSREKSGHARGRSEERRLDQLKESMERTEARLMETLKRIEDEFSFKSLSKDAAVTIRGLLVQSMEPIVVRAGDTMKQFSTGLLQKLERDPIPVAMLGIGVGLLLASVFSGGKSPGGESRVDGSEVRGNGGPDVTHLTDGPITSEEMQNHMDHSTNSVSIGSSDEGVKTGRRFKLLNSHGRNAIPVGMSVIAIGALAGFLLPMTGVERKMFRDWGSGVANRAKEKGREILQSAEAMIQEKIVPADIEAKK